jgi:hypothetical protein
VKFLIIGIAAVAVFVAVKFFVRKIRGLFKTPLRVHLVETTPSANQSTTTRHIREQLASLGFEEIGKFKIAEMPGVVLTAFQQPYQSVCAVLYKHPLVGHFADVFSLNEEGRSLTVTNAPVGHELDQPPQHQKIFQKQAAIQDMYDRLLKSRPAGPHKRIDASNFVDEFQSAYAREMDWRASRGGVTPDEVRRTAEEMGITSQALIDKSYRELQQELANKERNFPCYQDEHGHCPYEQDSEPGTAIEGMPLRDGDRRSCPKYRHICPVFVDELGLTRDDLHIRALIQRGTAADYLVRQGTMSSDSLEYRQQKLQSENARRMYPKKRYPQYY